MLVEYIKNSKGKRIGVVVATSPGTIGWSLCKKCDRFNPNLGLRIAEGRANFGTNLPNNVPYTVYPYMLKMLDRAKRYFKD